MDNVIKMIAEDLRDDLESSIVDDDLEEAFCFLSGNKSSYENLDECSKED